MYLIKLLRITLYLVIPLIIASTTAHTKEIYDQFDGNRLHADKWYEDIFVREVADGKLINKIGNTTLEEYPRVYNAIQNPTSINTLECEVRVNQADLDDEGLATDSYATIDGRWYNTRNNGDALGDVWAGVYLGNRGAGFEAWWGIWELVENGWLYRNGGSFQNTVLVYGDTYQSKVDYDGANGFIFTVANESIITQGPVQSGPAFDSKKWLGTAAATFAGETTTGYTSAEFDNLRINNQKGVYDNFEQQLNQDNWDQLETVRDVEKGRLRLNVQGSEQPVSVDATLKDDSTSYLEAIAHIQSDSTISAGASGGFFLQGVYYNTSRGPGSGMDYNGLEDDVLLRISLDMQDDNSLRGRASVLRYGNVTGTDVALIWEETFTMLVSFDTDYTISIDFTDSQIFFKLNEETITYTITSTVYGPSESSRKLVTALDLSPGQTGYIKTQIDAVYVADTDTDDDNSNDNDSCFILLMRDSIFLKADQ